MNFHSTWFDGTLWQMAWLPFVLVCALSLRAGGQVWHTRQSTLLAAAAVLVLPQLLQTQLPNHGFAYHLLGVNLACLMLGARAAWLAACVFLLLVGLARDGAAFFNVWAINALFTVLPACAVNVLLRRIGQKILQPNLFAYIFVYGFLGAAAGLLLTGAGLSALAWLNPAVPTPHFPVFLLLAWGEAFLSGLLCAVLIAFAPQLLSTFSDKVYLRREKQIWKD